MLEKVLKQPKLVKDKRERIHFRYSQPTHINNIKIIFRLNIIGGKRKILMKQKLTH